MPHVIVKMWPGRSEDQKVRLAEQIAKDVMEIVQCPPEAVSVALEEVKSEDWAEQAYKPEIQGKWDTLYRKPGLKT